MAMNAANMATEIIAAIDTLSDSQKQNQSQVMTKLCEAIVAHITTNGVISVINVDPGVGTAPGTIA